MDEIKFDYILKACNANDYSEKKIIENPIVKINALIDQIESLSQRVNALIEIPQKTLLDEFAGSALNALIAEVKCHPEPFKYMSILEIHQHIAEKSYEMAEAMMKAKKARESK